MIMLLKYQGNGYRVSFVPNQIYKAQKVHDTMGNGYAIFDEGEDWYIYGVNFLKENFVEVEETAENLRQAV